MNTIKTIRISFLAIALLVLLWSTWNYFKIGVSEDRHKYIPLILPIEIVEGRHFQGQFDVELDEPYEIKILFHRSIPQNDLDSLIGSLNSLINSENRKVVFPVSYSLWQDDSLILKSDSLDSQSYSYTNDYVGKIIDIFKGVKHKHYRINIDIRETIPALNKTSPVLRVSVIPSVYKTEYYNHEVARIVNERILLYSGILFIMLFIINTIFELRSRLTRRSS
jgi:hypothetical protein